MLGGVVSWLVVAGALWVSGTKLFQGTGQGATSVRLTGFAHAPLLVVIGGAFVSSPLSQLFVVAALLWFGAALAVAARSMFDLDQRQSAASAFIAVAVWWVLQLIGLGADLAEVVGIF
mgnify:CR=1 FL=1